MEMIQQIMFVNVTMKGRALEAVIVITQEEQKIRELLLWNLFFLSDNSIMVHLVWKENQHRYQLVP